MHWHSRSHHGGTLLELVIVAVILSIIAAVALSRFSKTTDTARLTEAEQQLNLIRSAEMRYLQDTGTYTNNLGQLAITLPVGGAFVYAIVSASATNFKASATGLGSTIYICRNVQPTTTNPSCP